MLPGGRGTGSEKMVPMPCACAGCTSGSDAAIASAANGTASAAVKMVFGISRGFKTGESGSWLIVQGYAAQQHDRLTRRIRRGKGRSGRAPTGQRSGRVK